MRFSEKIAGFIGFLKYLKGMKTFSGKIFYKGLAIGICAIFCAILWPLLLAKSFIAIQEGEINVLIISATGISFLTAQILSYYQIRINTKLVDQFSNKAINNLRETILNLTWSKYKVIERIYLVDVFMTYFWRIRTGILQLISQLLPNIIISFLLCTFVVAFFPKLFFIFFLLYFITLSVQIIGSLKAGVFVDQFHDAWKTQTFNLNRFFDQMLLLRLGRNTTKAKSDFKQESDAFIKSNSKMLNANALLKTLDQTLNILSKICFILYAVFLIEQKEMTWSELIIVFFVLNIVQTKISNVPSNLLSLFDGYFSYLKIINLFKVKGLNRQSNNKSHPELSINIKSIEFEKLCVCIEDKQIINTIDIRLQSGEIYLVKGVNGSGKTTLIETIIGLHPVNCERIRVNDKNVSREEYSSYKSNFAYVPQDTNLFSSSLLKNLLFGNEVDVQEFKNHSLWPSQFADEHRTIGENGKGLSGGEKKRLVILREIFYASSIIVFDEPENDLDDASITIFRELINELKKDKIIIVVAHSNTILKNIAHTKIF